MKKHKLKWVKFTESCNSNRYPHLVFDKQNERVIGDIGPLTKFVQDKTGLGVEDTIEFLLKNIDR